MCFGKKQYPKKHTQRLGYQSPQKGHAENVAIHLQQPPGSQTQKLAVMWYADSTNENVNLISAKLVGEVLHVDIQQTQDNTTLELGGNTLGVRGHVDLEWGLCEQLKKQGTHTKFSTRFMVTAMYDPPFDILVGRRVALECGLVKI